MLVGCTEPYNRSQLATVTVVVLTTHRRLAALPGNVVVPADLAGVEQEWVIDVTQIATIDRTLVEAQIGVLPAWLMACVDAGLARALALSPRRAAAPRASPPSSDAPPRCWRRGRSAGWATRSWVPVEVGPPAPSLSTDV